MNCVGTIIRVSPPQRFFGFIRPDIRDGRDVFFHGSQLRGGLEFSETLLEMRVRFTRVTTDKGFTAVNVFQLTDEAAAAPARDLKFEASQGS
jgi:cold shock CspA family protein